MPERVSVRTIANELGEAAERLERSGVANAKREATALWAAVAQLKPGDVWLKRASEAVRPVAEGFWAAVERRSSGVPFNYAVGCVPFRSLDLRLDPRALIPRPETEGLVDLVLDWAMRDVGRRAWGVAADVGTGCGCIALALATEGHFDRVVAVERSQRAAALARENVGLVRPRTPVDVLEGDLLAPLLPLAGAGFRVIVSNPPYLRASEYEGLDLAVKQFEPREALESGPDGLAATRALFAGAAALLEPGGMLALEIDERRDAAVRALAREYGWAQIAIHNDLFGRPRYALATLGHGPAVETSPED